MKKIGVLFIVAVIMVALAVLTSQQQSQKTFVGKPTTLLQGLSPSEIAKIEIRSANNSVTLQRKNDRFVLPEKGNYPADMKKVNKTILSLTDIKIADVYTDSAQNHEKLKVDAKNAQMSVHLFKNDASDLAGILLGDSNPNGQRYVRLTDSNTVYTAMKPPSFQSKAMDYIDRNLTDIKPNNIVSVTVMASGETYTLKKQDTEIVMPGTPAEKELDQTIAQQVLKAAAGLQFEDVQLGSTGTGLVFDREYLCRLEDSTVYTLNIAKKDDKTYCMIAAKFTNTDLPKTISPDESEEELKKKEALFLARDNAALFTQKHKGWVYQIPSYTADNLTKTRSDLLKNIEVPQPTDANSQ